MSLEIDNWFETEFWPTYKQYVKTPFPNKWGAGAKGEAKTKASKIAKTKDLRDRIMMALRSQMNHRKKLYDNLGSMAAYNKYTDENRDKIYANREAKTWFNNSGWDDEIPSLTEKTVPIQTDIVLCSCGQKATHGRMCSICFQRKVIDPKTGWDVKLRESTRRALEKNPKKSGESWAEWGKRLLTEGKFGNTFKPTSHNSQKN